MQHFISTHAMVRTMRPEHPVYCLRPQAVTVATRWFLERFPGRVLYAVKTNPQPWVIKAAAEAGLSHFDVASMAEIEMVAATLPEARLSFMHPVKSRSAIHRAYFEYGVRDFALDTEAELDKIIEVTGGAMDLNLFIRVAVSNRYSCLELSGKFGIGGNAAAKLLFKARQFASQLGITFHAGSQLMRPEAYREAMEDIGNLIRSSGVIIDILDVGGGFPSIYPGMVPPPLQDYVSVIIDAFNEMPVSETCELWCEPGRALVAEAASLVVRVELRKGNTLYLNDGTYGGLFDAGQPGFIFPVRSLRATQANKRFQDFSFYGPTCDSLDYMEGPFPLPPDVAEGDFLEVGGLGAYSMTLRTNFNGFNMHEVVSVKEGPMLSMYGISEMSRTTPLLTDIDKTDAADAGSILGD